MATEHAHCAREKAYEKKNIILANHFVYIHSSYVISLVTILPIKVKFREFTPLPRFRYHVDLQRLVGFTYIGDRSPLLAPL